MFTKKYVNITWQRLDVALRTIVFVKIIKQKTKNRKYHNKRIKRIVKILIKGSKNNVKTLIKGSKFV
jgi:hypothetical protein